MNSRIAQKAFFLNSIRLLSVLSALAIGTSPAWAQGLNNTITGSNPGPTTDNTAAGTTAGSSSFGVPSTGLGTTGTGGYNGATTSNNAAGIAGVNTIGQSSLNTATSIGGTTPGSTVGSPLLSGTGSGAGIPTATVNPGIPSVNVQQPGTTSGQGLGGSSTVIGAPGTTVGGPASTAGLPGSPSTGTLGTSGNSGTSNSGMAGTTSGGSAGY